MERTNYRPSLRYQRMLHRSPLCVMRGEVLTGNGFYLTTAFATGQDRTCGPRTASARFISRVILLVFLASARRQRRVQMFLTCIIFADAAAKMSFHFGATRKRAKPICPADCLPC